MLFKVESRSNGRSTHCGVLEFSADEGMVYMPYWVTVTILNTNAGSYISQMSQQSCLLSLNRGHQGHHMPITCFQKDDIKYE